ncbi:MAG: ABC transporter ATP-binding protein [Planctomycetota bacterium]|nr:ABC transporter ATP-binding protein [Planctomycetota bacterium]
MIQVEHLTKRFGETRAVDDVSFSVGRGEVVGFLGPNGAGKTTTIRVLTCFHPATEGSVRVAGYDVATHPLEVRRAIGYLPENVPLYLDMRVEEYLTYRADLKGVAKPHRRAAVAEAMERCGVTEVRRKMVGHVSRGYRQRVGLADALVARPPILILDEPTSGLDPNQRRRMKDLILELAHEHTVLFSSHILAEVADVASRILILHQGRLCADGSLDELLATAEGRTLCVTAALEPAALEELLDGLEGCGAARVDAVDGGYARLCAPVEHGVDPRDEAFARLRSRDVALRELALQRPTLESFFTQVTGAVAPAAPAEEASR